MADYTKYLNKICMNVDISQLLANIENSKNKNALASIFNKLDGLDSYVESDGDISDVQNLKDGKIDLLEFDFNFNIKNYLLDEKGNFSLEKAKKIFGEEVKIKDIKKAFQILFSASDENIKQYETNRNAKFADLPAKVRHQLNLEDEVEIITENGETLYVVNNGGEGHNYSTFNNNGILIKYFEKSVEGNTRKSYFDNKDKLVRETYQDTNGKIDDYDYINKKSQTRFSQTVFDYDSEPNGKKLKNITINSGRINETKLNVVSDNNGKIKDLEIFSKENVITISESQKQSLIDILNSNAKLGDDYELTINGSQLEISPLIKDENGDYIKLSDKLKNSAINFLKKDFHCPKDFVMSAICDEPVLCPTILKNLVDEGKIDSSDVLNFINTSKANDIIVFLHDYPNAVNADRNLAAETITYAMDDTLYVFDKNNGLIETITQTFDENTKMHTVHIDNTNNHIKQEIQSKTPLKSSLTEFSKTAQNVVTSFYDAENNLIRTETVSFDELKEIPVVTVAYPDGNKDEMQSVNYNAETNQLTLERNIVSPDGTCTEYSYEQNDNLKTMKYKITGTDGDTLVNKSISYEKISENKFISNIDGNSFEVEFNNRKITVIDKTTNKMHVIDLSDTIIIDEEMIFDILKKFTADKLIMMNSIPIKSLEYDACEKNNGRWAPDRKALEVCEHTDFSTTHLNKLVGVMVHEFGHYLDADVNNLKKHCISTNPEVQSLFKEELEALKQNATSFEQCVLGHLIGKFILDSESEIVAEANMLLSATEPAMGLRAFYYSKFFPKTISKISELIEQKEKSYI